MSASGKQLDVSALADDLIPTYLVELEKYLKNPNQAVVDADVFVISGRKADLNDIVAGNYFDSKGAKAKDFPCEETKRARFNDAMEAYCGNSQLTDFQKFMIVATNFAAASSVSGDKLTIGLIPYQSQPAAVNLAKQVFEEIQFQVLQDLSKAKPENQGRALSDLKDDPEKQKEISAAAQSDASFVLSLQSITKEMSTYKDTKLQKEAEKMAKVDGNDYAKLPPLEKKKLLERADDSLKFGDPKYKLITDALKAAANYNQSRDLGAFGQNIQFITERNVDRGKSSCIAISHRLTPLLTKLETAVVNELHKRDQTLGGPSPTKKESPSISGTSHSTLSDDEYKGDRQPPNLKI
jgi:hypothetical protein